MNVIFFHNEIKHKIINNKILCIKHTYKIHLYIYIHNKNKIVFALQSIFKYYNKMNSYFSGVNPQYKVN